MRIGIMKIPRFSWKSFSLSSLLIFIVVLACGLAWFVNPKFQRMQNLKILESRPDIVKIRWEDELNSPDLIDRILGTDMRVIREITFFNFEGDPSYSFEDSYYPPVNVSNNLIHAAADLGPYPELQLMNIRIEGHVTRFPEVTEHVNLYKVYGDDVSSLLNGLLVSSLATGWGIAEVPAFNDLHLEMLCNLQFEFVTLEDLNISGVGFKALTRNHRNLHTHLFVTNCSILDQGLEALVSKCNSISTLELEFTDKSIQVPDLNILTGLSDCSTYLGLELYHGHVNSDIERIMNQLSDNPNYFIRQVDEDGYPYPEVESGEMRGSGSWGTLLN